MLRLNRQTAFEKGRYFFLVALSCFFSGCFVAPQMRMSSPSDSTAYGGATVFLHELNEVEDVTAKGNIQEVSDLSPLFEVSSDSVYEYKIGPNDVVQIIVWEHPELTSPMGDYQQAGQVVSSKGTLFYPYVGEIKVDGITEDSLRRELTMRLSDKILANPQVDVKVIGYNSLRAFVFGEVKKPGYVPFDNIPLTLPEALNRAGGFLPSADVANVMLRRGNDVFTIDYLHAFGSSVPLEKIMLRPGDQLWVPSMESSNVYVLGEVGRPGSFFIRNGSMTLMEALADAGGLQAVSASSRSVYVIRNSSEKRIDVFHLNAKNAMALAIADRFPLRSHDIVYIDASGLATWNRVVGQVLPTVQTVYYGLMSREKIRNWINEK